MGQNTGNKKAPEVLGLFTGQKLDDQLASLKIAGASIAVFHEGAYFESSAGYANSVASIEVDHKTIFQIGSITKVFTATLMMKLAEAGQVDLEAPVSRYLPDFKVDGDSPPDAMTVRTLLDYSSGIEGQYFGDFGPDPDCLEQYVNACSELRMIHAPGEMRAYNSTSYCIAGRLIEVVCGQWFNDALAEQLLVPIGIKDYAFYDHDVARFRTAVGHYLSPESNRLEVDKNLRLPHSMSPAGSSLTITARGLLDFAVLHLSDGMTVEGDRYLSASSIQKMRTPSRTVKPNDSELLLAWAALPTSDGRMTLASGRTVGQNSFVFIIPEQDFAMSILTNTAEGGQQLFSGLGLQELENRTGVKVSMPIPPSPDQASGKETAKVNPAQYVGIYTNPGKIEVIKDGSDLRAEIGYNDPATGESLKLTASMLPMGDHKFGLVAEGSEASMGVAEFIFANSLDGVATHIATMGSVYGRLFAR